MNQQSGQTLAEWLGTVEEKDNNELLIYEARENNDQIELISELANLFDIDGEIQSEEHLHLVSKEKRFLVTYRDTGAFWYADFSKLNQLDYKPKLPEANDAAQIAEKYLKENNLLPENALYDGVHQAVYEQVEGKEKEKRIRHFNNICVQYRCSYDQIKTYGPGAKIKVHLGEGGEIIGLFYAIPQHQAFAKYPVLSRVKLEDILHHKLGVSLDQIKIQDVKLAYHAASCVQKVRFLQPVYIFDLAVQPKSKDHRKLSTLKFEMHPVPATAFAPIVAIDMPSSSISIQQDELLSLSVFLQGGTPPFKFNWNSNIDGYLGGEQKLMIENLSIAHKEREIVSHTIKVTIEDANGMQDSHQLSVKVEPLDSSYLQKSITQLPEEPDDPYVGVEWCNIYNNDAHLPNIGGTDDSARGFNGRISSLTGWSSRFDWGNDSAWEQDFKYAAALGGGTDTFWADNVHFAFFAGHGSSGSFWFNSSRDDHQMRAQDARWGDGSLNWIVLHACQTMRANFEWDVWCDAFKGLHQMFGFHSTTEGSTPPLGSRFAFWLSFPIFAGGYAFDMQTAWRLACMECFDSSMEYASIFANQSGTDTQNDHLYGYGHVSSDPVSPSSWCYYKASC